eukprot:4053825-Heterocapsa_arctica.AAC.1
MSLFAAEHKRISDNAPADPTFKTLLDIMYRKQPPGDGSSREGPGDASSRSSAAAWTPSLSQRGGFQSTRSTASQQGSGHSGGSQQHSSYSERGRWQSSWGNNTD